MSGRALMIIAYLLALSPALGTARPSPVAPSAEQVQRGSATLAGQRGDPRAAQQSDTLATTTLGAAWSRAAVGLALALVLGGTWFVGARLATPPRPARGRVRASGVRTMASPHGVGPSR